MLQPQYVLSTTLGQPINLVKTIKKMSLIHVELSTENTKLSFVEYNVTDVVFLMAFELAIVMIRETCLLTNSKTPSNR